MIISSQFEDLVEWHCQVLPQLSLEEEGKKVEWKNSVCSFLGIVLLTVKADCASGCSCPKLSLN